MNITFFSILTDIDNKYYLFNTRDKDSKKSQFSTIFTPKISKVYGKIEKSRVGISTFLFIMNCKYSYIKGYKILIWDLNICDSR